MSVDVAKKIVERAEDYGIPREDVVDPLIMPVGAINLAGRSALDLIIRLRTELKVNTTCGARTFPRPEPSRAERCFPRCSGADDLGHRNPLHAEEMTGIMGRM